MCEQIISIPILVDAGIVRFFGDASRAAQSNPDRMVIFVILTEVNRALPKGFRTAIFYSVVDKTVKRVYQSLRPLTES